MSKRQKGFTIFEMLVVIAIIALTTALILARYRDSQKQYALSQSAQILISDLRQAQAMALTGAEVSGYLGNIGGFGVRVTAVDSYEIFYNTTAVPDCLSIANRQPMRTIKLSPQINFINASNDEVFFIPPQPKTCINNSNLEKIIFTLKNISSGSQINVAVDKYGKIDIE
jgi:prepilin-type N-terminal cleavage/methylation domain-containing protein